MPIGLEVNDYDSEEDMSSTEDDSKQLPINDSNKKNRKLKSKKRNEKKTILKESKIVKDKAKQKIKNMESKLNDLEFFDYLKEKVHANETISDEENINNFFTDKELEEQKKELEKLEKLQELQWTNASALQWKEEAPIVKRSNTINMGMSGFLNRTRNESRTQKINVTSRVNTNLPTKFISRNIRNYRNIGKMW